MTAIGYMKSLWFVLLSHLWFGCIIYPFSFSCSHSGVVISVGFWLLSITFPLVPDNAIISCLYIYTMSYKSCISIVASISEYGCSADAVDHLNQIAHRPGIDRKAEFDLGGNFIAIGDRDFTHVVAETADFQMTGIPA